MGLGFLDENAPTGKTIEYRVESRGFNPRELGVVTVAQQSVLPKPANLRETAMYDGPIDLGIRPSPRGLDAEERHN
jgi:hypothetical protein